MVAAFDIGHRKTISGTPEDTGLGALPLAQPHDDGEVQGAVGGPVCFPMKTVTPSLANVVVSVSPLDHPERMLGAVDAEGHDAEMVGKYTPSIISATRSSSTESAANISASAVSVAATK